MHMSNKLKSEKRLQMFDEIEFDTNKRDSQKMIEEFLPENFV